MSDAAPRDPLLLLVAYADGELDADATALVETRLADSADLRNRLDDVRSLQAGLRAHLPPAPPELEWSRRRAVLAAATPWTVRSRIPWVVVRRVAAACLVLGLLGGLLLPSLTESRVKAGSRERRGGDAVADEGRGIWYLASKDGRQEERLQRELEDKGQAAARPSSPAAESDGDSRTGHGVGGYAKGAPIDNTGTAVPAYRYASAPLPANGPGTNTVTAEDAKSPASEERRQRAVEELKKTAPAAPEPTKPERLANNEGRKVSRGGRAERYPELSEKAKDLLNKDPAFAGPDLDAPEPGRLNESAKEQVATRQKQELRQAQEELASAKPRRLMDASRDDAQPQQNGRLADAIGEPATPVPAWRAPLSGADLAESPALALAGDTPIDDALAALGQRGQVEELAQEQQQVDAGLPTVNLQLDGLSRGQALLQTARAGGRQLRLLPDGIEVLADRQPLDPTGTAGLSRADFQAAFGTVPMASTTTDARLTFAFTADTASFDRARTQLGDGEAVEPGDIRAEHFVNAVPADYPPATGPEAFALYAEAGPSPFAAGPLAPRTALVSVGAVARPAGADERRPLALTLAIDCSGSMAQPGGLDRVRLGLDQLLARLGPDDSVAVVAFGDRARVVLPATPGAERERIAAALAGLRTGGATNAGEGLSLAYQLAAESAKPGRESRVLLATDGATLAGEGAAPVLERIAADRARGITLVVVGCGGKDYQGAALDALAAKGDGQHLYVGSDDEARALFRDKLVPARLGVLARDAKIQVTWNPQRVTHARLIGFETRRLAEHDFRDDGVDAGEIAHDTQATALFEVVLAEDGSGPLGSAAVRYLDTRLGSVRELACPLAGSLVKAHPSQRLRLQACSADLADLLGRTWWANQRCATYAALLAELQRCEPSPFRETLREMATAAQALTREP